MTLPIYASRAAINEAIATNPVTIIVAETGAGKSTQVPQYLLDCGKRVVVTQPRRLAARTVAERVAEERGTRFGDEVGYQVAGERVASDRTRCLFVTEGLALVRELFAGKSDYDVLILDEVHEWHEDMEILVAWTKLALSQGARFRLVLMSATMEADKLSAYFGGAPIISVPGRTFPVTVQAPEAIREDDGGTGTEVIWCPIARDVEALVALRRNVLVFAPGKREIELLCGKLAKLDAVVLPLHGQLDKVAQAACFRRYDRPKVVVATNVAQTSITIEDIDAVVDSGLERRTEVVSGVQGLYLRLVSEADSLQRAGRAGRCRSGIYIDHAQTIASRWSLAQIVAPPSGEVRAKWPTPEIRRVLLDRAVLRLAQAGFDLEQLELFHALDRAEIHTAKVVLRALGCLGDGIDVTPIGARCASLPVGVHQARMLIEAETRGCVREVMSLAAILEGQGIVDRNNVDPRTNQPIWRSHIADPQSDHISFLRLFERAERSQDRGRSIGCHGKAVADAMELRRRLSEEAGRHLRIDRAAKPASRDDILACVLVSHVDQLRAFAGTDRWGTPRWGSDCRKLGESTVVSGQPAWVVGSPFDVSTKKGGRLELLQFVSVYSPETIALICPSAIETSDADPRYEASSDVVTIERTAKLREVCQYAAGKQIATMTVSCTDDRVPGVIVDAVTRAIADDRVGSFVESHRDALRAVVAARSTVRDLNARVASERYPCGSDDQLRAFVRDAVGFATTLRHVPVSRFTLDLVSDTEVARVKALHPDTIEVAGQSYDVAYALDDAPVIDVGESAILAFPDALRTPGGRVVDVRVRFGWCDRERTSDIRALKATARERAAKMTFDDWRDRPTIEDDEIHEYAFADGAIAYGCRDKYNDTVWSLSRSEIEERRQRAILAALESEWGSLRYDLPYEHPLRSESPSTVDEWCEFVGRARAEVARIAAAKSAQEEQERQGALAVIAACEKAAAEVDADGYARHYVRVPDEDTAGRIFRFVRDIATMMPLSAALTILRHERDQSYGRGARASAISDAFPGVDHQGLEWKSGCDIHEVVAYVESLPGALSPARAIKKTKQSTPIVSASKEGFGTLGDLFRARQR